MNLLTTTSLLPGLGFFIAIVTLAQAMTAFARSLQRSRSERSINSHELSLLKEKLDISRARRLSQESKAGSWDGYRKFLIERKVQEGGGICSFYLKGHDGRPLASFFPGQYLTFKLKVPGQNKPVIRCYSLSDGPSEDYFRVSIKQVPPPRDKPDLPPGLGSTHFHKQLGEGDIIDVKAPSGKFYLDMDDDRPVVLIGGGVGLTPVLSMLNALAADGSRREVFFFYGVRNSSDHVFKDHLQELDYKNDKIKLHVCYSRPGDDDELGRDYQHEGRVSVDLFKEVLPSNNYNYYLCGPGPFMESITSGLADWGVPADTIHYEAFGPATIKKASAAAAAPSGVKAKITFAKSGKSIQWDSSAVSLLEFAEANGIALDSACRAGNCGTCLTAVKSGDVNYLHDPGSPPEPGSCLTCIAVPKSDLELDA